MKTVKTRGLRIFGGRAWRRLALFALTALVPIFALAQDAKLPEGVLVKIAKTEAQPAVAIVSVDGVETKIEAFEPLEKIPEAAREYVRAEWEKLGEFPKKTINVEINVDEAPEAADWAQAAKSRLIYWYPKIVDALDGPEGVEKLGDDFTIKLVFKPMDGVAYAAGQTITISSNWIKQRPDDFGLVVHEATHVAQHYRGGEVWAIEGIADYVRYYVSEPKSKNHWRIDPNRSKYTDSYGVTASFFDWLICEKDPEFMRKLHRALRSRTPVEKFCEDEYQTTFGAFWNEFISSLN